MTLATLLDRALAMREPLPDGAEPVARRLFHGPREGNPALVVDLLGSTLVLHDHTDAPAGDPALVRAALDHLRARLPFVRAALCKTRHAPSPAERNGAWLLGDAQRADGFVTEHGVRYALELTLNRDASFYPDLSLLRRWLLEHARGLSVLNAFAYTGSLGLAARVGGARRVVQLDRSGRFLAHARRSYALNGLSPARGELWESDFFRAAAALRGQGALFDVAVLDAPFFSEGPAGSVALGKDAVALLDKLRPLIGHEGTLAVVNNALFLSGAQWQASLDALCASGYLALRERVAVPDDFATPWSPGAQGWPADPAPFVHPTKVALLTVRRKDGRKASP